MDESILIESGGEDDIPDMVSLLEKLFSLEEDFDFDPRLQTRGLKKMLENRENRAIFVARHGRTVIGMCSIQTTVSTAEGSEAGLVEDLIVREDYRHRGVGRRLLEAVERWARTRNIDRLQLLSDRENQRAREFYQHCGWAQTRLQCLRKKILSE